MRRRLIMVMYGLLFMVFLSLTGCLSPAAMKPETAAQGSPGMRPPAAPGSAKGSPAVPPATETRQARESPSAATAPPSLEALRRGEAAVGGALNEVYFDFDKYDLRADAREALRANGDWLRANPSAQVEIEGHADERGTNEYNLALGAKRAQAAKDYLVTSGIAARRLSTISYGEEVPVCREKTEECWQRNRRARFVVISPKPAS